MSQFVEYEHVFVKLKEISKKNLLIHLQLTSPFHSYQYQYHVSPL